MVVIVMNNIAIVPPYRYIVHPYSEDDQHSDDDQTGTMFDDGTFYIEALLIINCKLQTCMFTDDGSANFVHDGNCMIHVESLETSKSLH